MATNSSSTPYNIEVIVTEDKEEVLELIRNFFIRDEPLTTAAGLLEQRERCVPLEKFLIKGYDNGISLKTVSNGKIIGLAINDIIKRGSNEIPEIDKSDEKFAKIITLVIHAGVQADVFSHFPGVDKGLDVKVLAVDSSVRGAGIAKNLMDKTREIARKEGCGLLTVECSSNFSAKAAKRLGLDCIYSLDYKDYKVDGEVFVVPEPPHTAITVYAQKL